VHKDADLDLALNVIINAKTAKISACNALDKVLIDKNLPNYNAFVKSLLERLAEFKVEVFVDQELSDFEGVKTITDQDIWYEEFLDYKIVIGLVDAVEEAISKINKYSGGHSSSIITKDQQTADQFMTTVDTAAVYHNASTRFTDGGQLGLGGELAISTDKLHQRGPIGLEHLVTNKWYIHGDGQIR